ncbi:PH domain-containing protein [Kribbella antibiotica]|uniref:PH domain-containing protein n=1 Tax=Kribbella antibiotica TaxID=190195 RepID=A0A4R4ZQH8_9ACTN|nr:PH domain-containing protein [Kribbella antibiotica]TDD60426.1 PH domain-containing protein [Kribbella antibiotica]
MKSNEAETETYLSTSNRISGVIVIVIGAVGLLDIVLEWRTATGIMVGSLIGILMVLAYCGLIRPSVTLSPETLLLRNHLRDRVIPWNQVSGADVADILRVHTDAGRFRAPGVQLVMRDLRKQRVGGRKLKADSSVSRADLVVGRIEAHMDQYGAVDGGPVRTNWARPELAIIGVLAVVAIVAALLR